MRHLRFIAVLSILAAIFLFSGWPPDQATARATTTTVTTTTTTSTTTTTTTSTTTTTIRNAKLIVAKNGGDFTTITDALNAINPSATSPYIIEVWPGTYTENVTMKSYVTLQGSGRDVTTIQPSTGDAIAISNLLNANVTIRGFTIKGANGVVISGSSSVRITENTITGNGGGTPAGVVVTNSSSITIRNNTIIGEDAYGVYAPNSSSVTICENTITSNRESVWDGSSSTICGNTINNISTTGIVVRQSSSTITGNMITGSGTPTCMKAIDFYDSIGGSLLTITGNIISNQHCGAIVGGGVGGAQTKIIGNIITNSDSGGSSYALIEINSDGIVSGNHVTGNSSGDGIGAGNDNITIIGNTSTGNSRYGIRAYSTNVVIHNRVTGNGTDISASGTPPPHVSFNVYDTITGTTVGSFNVKSDGTPWP